MGHVEAVDIVPEVEAASRLPHRHKKSHGMTHLVDCSGAGKACNKTRCLASCASGDEHSRAGAHPAEASEEEGGDVGENGPSGLEVLVAGDEHRVEHALEEEAVAHPLGHKHVELRR